VPFLLCFPGGVSLRPPDPSGGERCTPLPVSRCRRRARIRGGVPAGAAGTLGRHREDPFGTLKSYLRAPALGKDGSAHPPNAAPRHLWVGLQALNPHGGSAFILMLVFLMNLSPTGMASFCLWRDKKRKTNRRLPALLWGFPSPSCALPSLPFLCTFPPLFQSTMPPKRQSFVATASNRFWRW